MNAYKIIAYVVVMSILLLSGCGGGGGADTSTPPSTKTATLKFSSQSTIPSDLIGGFKLTVTLPVGSVIPTDSAGVPSSSAVYLSGKFAGATAIPPIISYDSTLRKLTVTYASTNNYELGEFLTILLTVPNSYVPNASDITYLFTAWDPGTIEMPTVTAIATFN